MIAAALSALLRSIVVLGVWNVCEPTIGIAAIEQPDRSLVNHFRDISVFDHGNEYKFSISRRDIGPVSNIEDSVGRRAAYHPSVWFYNRINGVCLDFNRRIHVVR